MLHILCTFPGFASARFQNYVNLIHMILGKISNIKFGDNNNSWLQATLPFNKGGVGIQRAVHLAPSSFLAFAQGSPELVYNILPFRFQHTPYQEQEEARCQGRNSYDDELPLPSASYRQKVWSLPRLQERFDFLGSSITNAKSRARLLAASAKESGAWLKALPVSSLGLQIDDEAIRIIVGLRLECPLCLLHLCADCSEDVDQYASHGFS